MNKNTVSEIEKNVPAHKEILSTVQYDMSSIDTVV